MGQVVYKTSKTTVVSDRELFALLDRISDVTGRTVEITSGDRSSVPIGGSRTSDHLAHRAADIHLAGLPDSAAFRLIRGKRKEIFGDGAMEFQVIHHGTHTRTHGEHIHIGHNSIQAKAGFWTEGLSSNSGYSRVEAP